MILVFIISDFTAGSILNSVKNKLTNFREN